MRITIILMLSVIIGSCRTNSHFNTPNNFLNADCRIFLINGTEVNGKLTVQFETGQSTDKYVKILTDGNSEKKILITDIKYYQYNHEYYFPKEVDLEYYEIPLRDKIYSPNIKNVLFLKRLTNDKAKLHLFELFKSRTNTLDGMDHYDYYISFNDENRFVSWSIRGRRFFPNFEEKMSKIVWDCDSLAEKIRQKTNAYTVRQISVDAKKNDVIKKIVEEYNACE